MKKIALRFLSFATAAVLLAGATACSSGDQNASSEPGSSGSGSSGSAESGSADTSPVTLSVEGLMGVKQDGVQNDPVSKYITEKTGITLNVMNVPDGAGSTEKYSAQLASGDLPDIFCNPFPLKKLIDADQVYALDDLVAKYGKNLNADTRAKAMIKANKLMSPDGKLYVIGAQRGTLDSGSGATRGQYIRWDLYKKLGYPEIKDLDGLTDVLIKMQALEPKTKDGKKTYVTGSTTGNGSLGFSLFVGDLRTRGLTEHYPDFITYVDNATKKPSPENYLKDKDSVFWKCFKNASKLYRLGLFDPDSFTQTGDQYSDKVNAGTYMYVNESWSASGLNDQFKAKGEADKGMVALPASVFGYDNYLSYENDTCGERGYCISKNCKNPERAMQLLDFVSTYEFSRIANNGLEGTNWTMKNGVPTPTEAYLNMAGEENDANNQKTGAGIYTHFCGYKYGTIDPETKTPVDCRIGAKPLTNVQKDFVSHFGAKTMPEVYQQKVKNYSFWTVVDWGTMSDDMTNYQTNLMTYMEQGETKAIMAKSDAEFEKAQDDFIKGLDAYKEEDLFKFCNDNASSSLEKMKPVYDMLNEK